MSSAQSPPAPRLTRERVVDAAIALADAEGLDATSMRRLAETLGVTPMALYKHVAHREELIDGMVDRIVESFAAPAPGEWQRMLRARILAARAVVRRHPWARSAIETRAVASPVVLAYMDALIATMFAGRLSADLVHHAMHALSTRMWGFTRDVMPLPSLPEDPAARAESMRGYAALYPGIIRMATTAPGAGQACDEDYEFTLALDILLDAFARMHAEGWSSDAAVPAPA